MSINQLCRLCAERKPKMQVLLSEAGPQAHKIEICLGMKVVPEDLLPKSMCQECVSAVDMFHTFKLKCLKAEQKLNSILSSQLHRKIPIVKQEIGEAPPRTHLPTHDHSYFNVAVPHPLPLTSNVKREFVDEPEESEFRYEEEEIDKADAVSFNLNQHSGKCSPKPEIELIPYESKPILEVRLTEDDESSAVYKVDVADHVAVEYLDDQDSSKSACTEDEDIDNVMELTVQQFNRKHPKSCKQETFVEDDHSVVESLDMAHETIELDSGKYSKGKTRDELRRNQNKFCKPDPDQQEMFVDNYSAAEYLDSTHELDCGKFAEDVFCERNLVFPEVEVGIEVEEVSRQPKPCKPDPDQHFIEHDPSADEYLDVTHEISDPDSVKPACTVDGERYLIFQDTDAGIVESFVRNPNDKSCKTEPDQQETFVEEITDYLTVEYLDLVAENNAGKSEAVCAEGEISERDLVFQDVEMEEIVGNSSIIPNKPELAAVSSEHEFSETDLILKDGESCDIDMEEIEAEIAKKSNPGVLFQCKKCPNKYKFYKGLKKHSQAHVETPNAITCDRCVQETGKSQEFASLATLNAHTTRLHLREPDFKCKVCAEAFVTVAALRNHERTHGLHRYRCRICKKILASKLHLERHKKIKHGNDSPIICEVCGERSKTLGSLKKHVMSHSSSEEKFLCSICGIQLQSSKLLNDHFNTHSLEKPYECDQCPFVTAHYSSLIKHKAWSHKKTRFKCRKCEKAFPYKYLLTLHSAIHSGLRPFSCDKCPKTFASSDVLNKHKKIHEERKFECEICSGSFTHSYQLSRHYKTHAGNESFS